MNTLQWKMDTDDCELYLVASEKGLKGIYWSQKKAPFADSLKGKSPQVQFLRQTVKELESYFNGKLQSFTVPLDLEGTEFQKKVWKQLSRIPYGKTLSYKEVAQKIKSNGIRAVGTANGRNPISIIIPCHRVIATGGGLGGYAGGLTVKKKLLDLEKRAG